MKKEAIFSDKNGMVLKCFREIGSWFQNDWCPYMNSLSVNNIVPKNDKIDIVSNLNDTNTFDNVNDAFDESMSLFIDEYEDVNDIAESNNNAVLERSDKVGSKSLIGGSSEEIFLTLSHASCDF